MSTYNGSVGVLFECVKEFSARLGDEVSLKPGDKVELISDDREYGDGWYMGKNLSTGQVGLYPKAFTKQISEEVSGRPGLLRSRSRRSVNSSPVTPMIQQFNELSMVEESPNVTMNSMNSNNSSSRNTGFSSSVHNTLNDIDRAIQELGGGHNHDESLDADAIEPGAQLDPTEVESWTPEQVTMYFSYLNFDMESAGKFARHKISGAILIELELSYLKELDISSFGTRFEIYKEIEELRAAAKRKNSGRASSLQSAPSVRRQVLQQQQQQAGHVNAATRPLGHARKRSQSMDDIPVVDRHRLQTNNSSVDVYSSPASSRPMSMATGFTSPALPDPPAGEFESPRRVPKPPVDAQAAYRFGGSSTPEEEDELEFVGYHSRQSSKGAASSVYPDHQRTNSALSFSRTASPVRHQRTSSKDHRRYSSIASFHSARASPTRPQSTLINREAVDQLSNLPELASPKRRSVSAKEAEMGNHVKDPKRTFSEAVKRPSGRGSESPVPQSPSVTTLGFRRKAQTSAFQEGIRNVTVEEAIKDSDYSGWMSKRGNVTIGSWKNRFFVLHGTRLSYFANVKDRREKGLIDITSHRVLPAKENDDKFAALYAASTGSGRYCFKLVPPAPGSRKGLTFTQQKVHYFAVDTKEEMRGWMAALMKATIDMDESTPVVSSCATPTVSLQRAQEMLAQARDYARKKDIEDEQSEPTSAVSTTDTTLDPPEMSEPSPVVSPEGKRSTGSTPTIPSASTPKSLAPPKIDTAVSTPHTHSGFSSPYLLASGMLGSPKEESPSSPDRPSLQRKRTTSTNPTPMVTNLEEMTAGKRVSSFRKR